MQVPDLMETTRLTPSKGSKEVKYVIDAFRHKTSSSKGGGYIYMNPELYKELRKNVPQQDKWSYACFLDTKFKPLQTELLLGFSEKYFEEINISKTGQCNIL